MSTGLFVIRLGELPDQFFKDIAHVSGGDFLRGHISFGGIKLLQGHEQNATLYHQLHGVGKVKVIDDILDIGGEALQIGFKVDFRIVRVSDQLCKIVVAGIIEIKAGDTAQNSIPGRALNMLCVEFLCHLHNGCLGGLQSVIKTLQHGHRQNHFAVLMWFEQAHKVGGDFPDQIGFRLYICICLLLQLSHRHNRCSSLLDFPYECCRVTHVNIIGVDIDGFCHQRHSVLATVITGMGVDIQLPPIVINGNEVTHCNAGCFA